MTVKELIEELKLLKNQDAPIYFERANYTLEKIKLIHVVNCEESQEIYAVIS